MIRSRTITALKIAIGALVLSCGCSVQPPKRPASTPPASEPILTVDTGIADLETASERAAPTPRKVLSRYDALLAHFMKGDALPKPAFKLVRPGEGGPPDYSKYGTFTGIGTPDYRYEIKDMEGLKAAVGEGIYPNQDAVTANPVYREIEVTGALDESHWESLKAADPRVAFFAWAQAHEEPGVKAFFTAQALEKAGLILHAVKAYQAVVIHYSRSACWSADNTFVWYVAPAAIGNIRRLCTQHPALGWSYVDAEVRVENGRDTDLDNDVVTVKPGRFVRRAHLGGAPEPLDLETLPIVERRGWGQVQAVRFSNGHWQLHVNGAPFVVRGVTYGPTEIGYGPANDPHFGTRWQFTDKNANGRADAPYDAWVDANANGIQDADEPSTGDFQLLREMGCNAIRFFLPTTTNGYDPELVNKELFRDLYARFGIYVIAGDFLGAYTVGSGASWKQGTDYTDPQQRRRMKEVVRQKVLDLRDEPWVLMWLLGNENNMGGDKSGVNATRTNASAEPIAYAEFVNEVAEMIHELDPERLVAIGNLETGLGEYYAVHAPAVDVFGINSYRGLGGFGTLWQEAQTLFDRPILVLEYGCDAYAQGSGPDEDAQAAYHFACLKDIVLNQAGGELAGNSIGGVIFEYLDEWWKAGDSATHHATNSQWAGPMPDGLAHEEWFGIAGQGTGRHSPFERCPRQTYHMYKTFWSH